LPARAHLPVSMPIQESNTFSEIYVVNPIFYFGANIIKIQSKKIKK